MTEANVHAAAVDVWTGRLGKHPAADALLRAYERLLEALWRQASLTLGEVTLVAVGDRILVTLAERYPLLRTATAEPAGLRFDGVGEAAANLPGAPLAEALRGVLLEFLTVLGHLTAEVLTPALHAELARSSAPAPGPTGAPRADGKGGTS
jgi:hypothetical protein